MRAVLATLAVALVGCGGIPATPEAVPYATVTSTPSATPCAPRCTLTLAIAKDGPPPTLTPTPEPTSAPAPTSRPVNGLAAGVGDVIAIPGPSDRWAPGNYTGPDEVRSIAREVGWPEGVIEELVGVIYGDGTCAESRGYADRNKAGGPYYGLLQLEGPFWFNYAGQPFARWADAYVNLATGLAVYRYYLARSGYGWAGWECQPP